MFKIHELSHNCMRVAVIIRKQASHVVLKRVILIIIKPIKLYVLFYIYMRMEGGRKRERKRRERERERERKREERWAAYMKLVD